MSKNDTSSITTVMKDFKNQLELKRFAEAQHQTISALQKKLDIVEEENKHLKELLLATNKPLALPTTTQAVRMDVTPEESIVVEQIDFLRAQSSQRKLTIEEVKILDLLIKNLKLIKNEATAIVAESRPVDLPEAKLLELASRQSEG